jgi:hypothetical protein
MILTAATALSTAAACAQGRYKPGGDGVSRDQFTYESASWMPQTVTVHDTRTGEAIWSLDIPVGQQLVVRFVRDAGPDEFYPDAMKWEVMERGTRKAALTHMIGVPPADARLIEPTLRPAPEMPGTRLSSGDMESLGDGEPAQMEQSGGN